MRECSPRFPCSLATHRLLRQHVKVALVLARRGHVDVLAALQEDAVRVLKGEKLRCLVIGIEGNQRTRIINAVQVLK